MDWPRNILSAVFTVSGLGFLAWGLGKMWDEGGHSIAETLLDEMVAAQLPVVDSGIQAGAMLGLGLFITWAALYSLNVYQAKRGYIIFAATVVMLGGLARQNIFIPGIEPTLANALAFLLGFSIALGSEYTWEIPSIGDWPGYHHTGGLSELSEEHSSTFEAFKESDNAADERGIRPVNFSTAESGLIALLVVVVAGATGVTAYLAVTGSLSIIVLIATIVGSIMFIVPTYSSIRKSTLEARTSMFGIVGTGKTLVAYGIFKTIVDTDVDHFQYWSENDKWTQRLRAANRNWNEKDEKELPWGFESTTHATRHELKFANTDTWKAHIFSFWDYPGGWTPFIDTYAGGESTDEDTSSSSTGDDSSSADDGEGEGKELDSNSGDELDWDIPLFTIHDTDEGLLQIWLEEESVTEDLREVIDSELTPEEIVDNVDAHAREQDYEVQEREKLLNTIERLAWVTPILNSTDATAEIFKSSEIDVLRNQFKTPERLVKQVAERDGDDIRSVLERVVDRDTERQEDRIEELTSIFAEYQNEVVDAEEQKDDDEGQSTQSDGDSEDIDESIDEIRDEEEFQDRIKNDYTNADYILWTVDAARLIQRSWIGFDKSDIVDKLNSGSLTDDEEKIIKAVFEGQDTIIELEEATGKEIYSEVFQQEIDREVILVVTMADLLYPFYRAEKFSRDSEDNIPLLDNVTENDDFPNFAEWVETKLQNNQAVRMTGRISTIHPVMYKTEVVPERQTDATASNTAETATDGGRTEGEDIAASVDGDTTEDDGATEGTDASIDERGEDDRSDTTQSESDESPTNTFTLVPTEQPPEPVGFENLMKKVFREE